MITYGKTNTMLAMQDVRKQRNPAFTNNSPLVGFDMNLAVGTNERSKLKKPGYRDYWLYWPAKFVS